jgi:CheY-like chemotaxis protein
LLAYSDEVKVVLTDMMMPVMGGLAAIQVLLRLNPTIKIIAASGLTTNGKEAKASAAGIKHFLMKPYSAAMLLKTIRSVLDEN